MCLLGLEGLLGNISSMAGCVKGTMFSDEFWKKETKDESQLCLQAAWGEIQLTFYRPAGRTQRYSADGVAGQGYV